MRRSLIEKKIYKLIREGISEYHLIDNGDKILVGLSGGKDSLALVDFLSKIKHLFENLEYYALHVRVDGIDYKSDENYLRDFCMSRGFHFISKNISFEADRDLNRTPCFLCSWNRRKILFETAQELGCHKLALGHHQDDILQTALMNLAFNGSFSTMPAYLQMRKMEKQKKLQSREHPMNGDTPTVSNAGKKLAYPSGCTVPFSRNCKVYPGKKPGSFLNSTWKRPGSLHRTM